MPPEGQGHLGAVAGGAQVDLYDARFEPLPFSFQTYSALTRRPPLALAVQAKKFTALDGASEQQGDLKVRALPPTIHARLFSCPSQLQPSSIDGPSWCHWRTTHRLALASTHCLIPHPACSQSIVLHNMKYAPKRPTSAPRPPLAHAIAPFHRLQHVKSSFPLAVGAEISAVDNDCFSSTGKPFSFIALGNAESSQEKVLQEDDISLAYEFASKFPGYTAECAAFRARPSAIRTADPPPLAFAATSRRRGWEHEPRTAPCRRPRRFRADAPHPLSQIHEVQARRFVLVSADHPIVSAISENADKLQASFIAISTHSLQFPNPSPPLANRWARSRCACPPRAAPPCYAAPPAAPDAPASPPADDAGGPCENLPVALRQASRASGARPLLLCADRASFVRSILPMVKAQVSSQIKVRDLSRCTVTASPAQFSSWNEARSELCACRRVQPCPTPCAPPLRLTRSPRRAG